MRNLTVFGTDDYELHREIIGIKFYNKRFIKYSVVRGFFSILKGYVNYKKNGADAICSHIVLMGYVTVITWRLYGLKLTASEHTNHYIPEITFAKRLLWN